MMRKLACTVLEADPLAHRLLERGEPAYEEVVREFGLGVLDSDGRINRRKLGEIVFADPQKLLRLNRIVHPRVIELLERKLAELARAGATDMVVVEAALLIEAGYHERVDRLVVVWCWPEQQRERLLSRGMTREQAERRITAQMPLEEKRRLADEQVDCSGSLAETRIQVEALVAKLKQLAAA